MKKWHVTNMYICDFYDGKYEGRPNFERDLAWRLAGLERMWGKRATHVAITPEDRKKWFYAAWLVSYETRDPLDDGEELVVVWTSDDGPEARAEVPVTDEIFSEKARGFGW